MIVSMLIPTDDPLVQAFLCCSPPWWCGQVLTDAYFPESEQLWEGSTFKFLGSAVYYKKILFISVQVGLSTEGSRVQLCPAHHQGWQC